MGRAEIYLLKVNYRNTRNMFKVNSIHERERVDPLITLWRQYFNE